jgi:hypothetical protein
MKTYNFKRDHDHELYKQMKSSQNIQRLGHTKLTSYSLDFVLKTLERASDLKMLIYFQKIIYLGFVTSGVTEQRGFFSLNT